MGEGDGKNVQNFHVVLLVVFEENNREDLGDILTKCSKCS